jgi:hypothetical protein
MNINEAFPSQYLKASDLNGSAVPVVISHVEMGEVGKTKEHKPVIYFKGKQKGMVLNKTNSKKIADITGSPDTDDWTDHAILIYPTEVDFQGETVEAIRVKAPTQKKPQPVKPAPAVDIDDSDIPF